ncbi:MAG: hypothetical protein EA378_11565 [Phycisphaerales bacterium]|nr:MAG: hypothetical protein EA378_11565 [Phycisphaerales bacterium]
MAYFVLASLMYDNYWRSMGEPYPWEHLLWITPSVVIVALPWVLAFTSLRKVIPKRWQWAIYALYAVAGLAFYVFLVDHYL